MHCEGVGGIQPVYSNHGPDELHSTALAQETLESC
jgi:hypothetical protein